MDAATCLQMLRDIKDVSFSTVDQDHKPQVRIIDVMLVEDDALYFCTARGKDFYQQLISNKQVAVVGMNQQFQMIRLSGEVHKLPNHKDWIDRIFIENPSMKDVYPNDSRYILEAFCISSGELEFFDLSKRPIYRESFVFGKAKQQVRGYFITDDCIQCGTCFKSCPQRSIVKGEPYMIIQKHCLHCGLCLESCPVKAIERRR